MGKDLEVTPAGYANQSIEMFAKLHRYVILAGLSNIVPLIASIEGIGIVHLRMQSHRVKDPIRIVKTFAREELLSGPRMLERNCYLRYSEEQRSLPLPYTKCKGPIKVAI